MIETLIALGVPQRFAKAVFIALCALIVISLLAVGKCAYDASIISDHDEIRSATIANDARAGEANAANERREDDAAISNQSEEVQNAVQALPPRPISPRQHARACVLLRQQAGSAGLPASTGC